MQRNKKAGEIRYFRGMIQYLIAGLVGAGVALAQKPKKKGVRKMARGGEIDEDILVVDVVWRQLNEKGLGKFRLKESDVDRLEDDYGSTYFFEPYDYTNEKPISYTEMKNILDKSMKEMGLLDSNFAKGGKTTTQGLHKFTLPAIMVAEYGLGGSERKRDIYHDRANDRFYMFASDGDLEEIRNYYPIQKLRGLVDLMTEEGIKGYAKGGMIKDIKVGSFEDLRYFVSEINSLLPKKGRGYDYSTFIAYGIEDTDDGKVSWEAEYYEDFGGGDTNTLSEYTGVVDKNGPAITAVKKSIIKMLDYWRPSVLEAEPSYAHGGRVSTYEYEAGRISKYPFDVIGRKDGMVMYHTRRESIKDSTDKAEELLENGYDEVLIGQP